MSLVAGVMVPHPPLIVPAVGRGEERIVQKTIDAYQEAARFVAQRQPDVIVLTSPHAPLFRDAFHISRGAGARGDFGQFRAPQERFEVSHHVELAQRIAANAQAAGIPVAPELPDDAVLDHGTMVPLWFLREAYRAADAAGSAGADAGEACTAGANAGAGADSARFPVPVVRIGLSMLPLETHRRLGAIVRDAASDLGLRVAFVASGDLSHKLTESGPYGLDPAGPAYDERIMDVMGRAAWDELLEFPDRLCEDAAECGHRSFIIMGGAFGNTPVRATHLSHEPQTGVGYGVCTYEPAESPYVQLARASLSAYIERGEVIGAPDDLPAEAYSRRAGAFVSLHEHGELRGCIGTISPVQRNLAQEIIENAISAATRDPRFPPVAAREIPHLEISVDILGDLEPVGSPAELDPARYGVVVSRGFRRGLLLPNLDGVDTVDEQLRIVQRKAGIAPDEPCELQRFEVVRYF